MTFDARLTELIALGAATAANCAACLEHHVARPGRSGFRPKGSRRRSKWAAVSAGALPAPSTASRRAWA
jgi:AhpD family alkylhydroperoxidase